jgi:hypothetical protein
MKVVVASVTYYAFDKEKVESRLLGTFQSQEKENGHLKMGICGCSNVLKTVEI